MKDKLICIGGGVGPMAGVKLHELIIENTKTDGTDQDHLEVHHLSRSHDIGDRTKYLLGEISENPAEGMFRTAQAAVRAAEEVSKRVVFGVPCNTFHAPKIFNYFLELIEKNNLNIQVINMIEEIGNYMKQEFPSVKKIGVMSTIGTREIGVYNEILEKFEFEIIQVPEEIQDELHDSIYNKDWGIKAVSSVSEKGRNNFLKYADILIKQGAEVIILGCTEIPLALPEKEFKKVPLVDPMVMLARAMIEVVDEGKLI